MQHENIPSERNPSPGWLNEIDFSARGFWEGLSAIGDMRFHYESAEVAFEFSADFQTGFINEQNCFSLIHPSASIDTGSIRQAFTREQSHMSPPALEFDFDDYAKRVRFSVLPATNLRTFSRFTETFIQDRYQESDAIKMARNLDAPQLCPCCQDAGLERVRNIKLNPLTRMLQERVEAHGDLLISLSSNDSKILAKTWPSHLELEGCWLAFEDSNSRFRIHIPSLHGFHFNYEEIDGISHAAIKVLNTHGIPLVKLLAPEHKVSSTWHSILNQPGNGYRPLTPK